MIVEGKAERIGRKRRERFVVNVDPRHLRRRDDFGLKVVENATAP